MEAEVEMVAERVVTRVVEVGWVDRDVLVDMVAVREAEVVAAVHQMAALVDSLEAVAMV